MYSTPGLSYPRPAGRTFRVNDRAGTGAIILRLPPNRTSGGVSARDNYVTRHATRHATQAVTSNG